MEVGESKSCLLTKSGNEIAGHTLLKPVVAITTYQGAGIID